MSAITRAGRWLAARPFVLLPLAVVLALAGWWAFNTFTGSSSSAAAGFGSQTVQVTQGSMDQSVTSTGTVAVADQQDASFSSSGTVTAVNVSAGQAVKAGDVLATIDSAELEAAVADAETTLAEAEAKLTSDTSSGASSAQLEADRTSITSAEDRLASAQDDLAGASLVAEFDGTVATVDLTVGEQLGSSGTSGTTMTGSASGSGGSAATLGSSSSSGGTAAPGGSTGSTGGTGSSSTSSTSAQIVVVSSSSYTVELSLDSTEITSIAVGQPATVTLVSSSSSSSSSSGFPGGGFPGGGFPGQAGTGGSTSSGSGSSQSTSTPGQISGTTAATGTVTEVDSVADASSGVARYAVTVSFTDTSGEYNAGASVGVAITYSQTADDTLSVPSRAVTTSSGASTVQVSTGSGTETRTVTTGSTVNGMTEITSGLSAGESVVIAGFGGPGQQSGQGGQTNQSGQTRTGQSGYPTGAGQ
jgi:multidrug efflux pump subunit AcrA (membrane-fusion protein)